MRFGDFFFFRDLGVRDGLLNRRLDRVGKITLAASVGIARVRCDRQARYRKLDDVRRLSNALSRLVSMSGR